MTATQSLFDEILDCRNINIESAGSDQDDDELCAISSGKDQTLAERSVEKVLNPGRNAEEDEEIHRETKNTPIQQVSGSGASLEMLCRVFPFHSKKSIKSILDICGGDVAKAVQHLVGANRPSASMESPESVKKVPAENVHASTTNLSSEKLILPLSGSKSAFQPTNPSPTSMTPHFPFIPDFSHPHGSLAAAAAAGGNAPLNFNFPALRMMYSNPAAMMPLLHPSYLAHTPSSWLLPAQQYRQHLCLSAFDSKSLPPQSSGAEDMKMKKNDSSYMHKP